MTPHPADPWDEDTAMAIRKLSRLLGGNGNSDQAKWATWTLGLFGACIVVMLGFVLNAVYSTNGDLHEMKGQTQTLQSEISTLQAQVSALSQEMGVLDGRRSK